MQLDVLIFGGGVAGLWLLDALARAGQAVLLLEADALGAGQTIASQGIIHGGLKYTLDGLLNRSAGAVRGMPDRWRASFRGEAAPDLRGVRLRAESCHLWRTQSLRSRLGMVGARRGLRVRPQRVERDERPAALRECPGDVFALGEPVICPQSLLRELAAQHRGRIIKVDLSRLALVCGGAGVERVAVSDPLSGVSLELAPRHVVFAAGAGNEALRGRAGLSAAACQRRALHMVLVRGDLPALFGHCVDGARTRVTITSADAPAAGRGAGGACRVWQVGGQVAEDGVAMDARELIDHARRELLASIPGLRLDGLEWSTYRIDRAEARAGGRRPDGEVVRREGNVLTAWPTKLALAPCLAERVCAQLDGPRCKPLVDELAGWPRPAVADLPWEAARSWYVVD